MKYKNKRSFLSRFSSKAPSLYAADLPRFCRSPQFWQMKVSVVFSSRASSLCAADFTCFFSSFPPFYSPFSLYFFFVFFFFSASIACLSLVFAGLSHVFFSLLPLFSFLLLPYFSSSLLCFLILVKGVAASFLKDERGLRLSREGLDLGFFFSFCVFLTFLL